jgi:hypothetical protein
VAAVAGLPRFWRGLVCCTGSHPFCLASLSRSLAAAATRSRDQEAPGPQGVAGPKGEKGDPGPAASATFRVVTGNPSVSFTDNEILVSLIGAPEGSKCTSEAVGWPGASFRFDDVTNSSGSG